MRCIFFLLLVLPLSTYSQCSTVPVPFEQRTGAAEVIVKGAVTAQRCFWSGNRIYTENTIVIDRVVKGDYFAHAVKVMTMGGVVGTEMMTASSLLKLSVGHHGYFLLRRSSHFSPAYEVVASAQGFLPVKNGQVYQNHRYIPEAELFPAVAGATAYDVVHGSRALTLITSVEPAEISAGTGSVLTIRGSGFGNQRGSSSVLFPNADDGGDTYVEAPAGNYLSWSETEIRVKVPDKAGTGFVQVDANELATSLQKVFITFSRITLEQNNQELKTYLFNKDGTGGYVWQYSPSFSDSSAAIAAFLEAFKAWRCSTGVNWSIGGNTPVDVTERDNFNTIRFDVNHELPEGVLGVCFSYFSSCNEKDWLVSELDIVFTTSMPWEFGPDSAGGGEFDFQTIAQHELGHGIQLGHVINRDDLMHYAIGPGRNKRILNLYNIQGGRLVVQESAAARICGREPMAPILNGLCHDPESGDFKFTDLDVFPNPTQGITVLSFMLEDETNVELRVFDASGRLVSIHDESRARGKHDLFLNAANTLSPGVYFISLRLNGDRVAVEKLVVTQ